MSSPQKEDAGRTVTHSALPWGVFQRHGGAPIYITCNNKTEHVFDIALMADGDQATLKANAAFIVRAVNSHADLVAACVHAEAVLSIVEPRSDKAEYLETLHEIRAALAKASP